MPVSSYWPKKPLKTRCLTFRWSHSAEINPKPNVQQIRLSPCFCILITLQVAQYTIWIMWSELWCTHYATSFRGRILVSSGPIISSGSECVLNHHQQQLQPNCQGVFTHRSNGSALTCSFRIPCSVVAPSLCAPLPTQDCSSGPQYLSSPNMHFSWQKASCVAPSPSALHLPKTIPQSHGLPKILQVQSPHPQPPPGWICHAVQE